jgi:hypothetical protein
MMAKREPSIRQINFTKENEISPKLEEAIRGIAEHFKKRRNYVEKICSMIMNSKRWKVSNISMELQKWSNVLPADPGKSEIVSLISKIFMMCKDQEDIKIVRGHIFEALLIGFHGGEDILYNDNYGWNSIIRIQEQNGTHFPILYECNSPKYDNCHNRSTIDFGFWNGSHAELNECKVQPERIGCKEINYMFTVQEELKKRNISHEIFFFCPSSEDDIKLKIKEFGGSVLFKPRGTKYLRNIQKA